MFSPVPRRISRGKKFPVAPVESAPMNDVTREMVVARSSCSWIVKSNRSCNHRIRRATHTRSLLIHLLHFHNQLTWRFTFNRQSAYMLQILLLVFKCMYDSDLVLSIYANYFVLYNEIMFITSYYSLLVYFINFVHVTVCVVQKHLLCFCASILNVWNWDIY